MQGWGVGVIGGELVGALEGLSADGAEGGGGFTRLDYSIDV